MTTMRIGTRMKKRMNWKHREERIRLDIIKDLVKYDLLTCKPISDHRQTAHITRTLPDDPTLVDVGRTSVDFYTSTTSKAAVI